MAHVSFRLLQTRRLAVVFACALLLAGCNFKIGSWVSLFDDEPAVARVISGIQSRYTGPIPMLKLVITDAEMVLQAQDPRGLGGIAEWRMVRQRDWMVNWDRVVGPYPAEQSLLMPGMSQKERLFSLDEIDLPNWGRIADAAIARAGLQGSSGVSSIEVSRTTAIVPGSRGAIRWTVEVRSEQESARIFANARGAITGANLNGTLRMRNLTILQRPEVAADAVDEVRAQIGNKALLTNVSFSPTVIAFQTNIRDPSYPIAGLRANSVYNWTYNGLQRASGSIDTGSMFSNPNQPFALDDVDWSGLPAAVAAARSRLGMPDGRITRIEANNPGGYVGTPVTVWRIDIEDKGESGTSIADMKGRVKALTLPPSRRTKTDWLVPANTVRAVGQIVEEFGPDAKIQEIIVHDTYVGIKAQDPRKPGEVMDVQLRETGLTRFGSNALFPGKREDDFEAKALLPIQDKLAELAESTLEHLKFPPGSITRVTIERRGVDAGRKGLVAEFRLETAGGRGGLAIYEFDGSEVRVIRR